MNSLYDVLDAIPPRRPITIPNVTTTLLPLFSTYYVMAVLVQQPKTSQYRLALFPIVLWFAFQTGMTLDFSWQSPGHAYMNQGIALAMFTVAMRVTAWTFAKEPYKREVVRQSEPHINGDKNHESQVSVTEAMWNAWDLIVNLRGLGWNWPRGLRIPSQTCHTDSVPIFLVLSLVRLAFYTVAFDVTSGAVRSFSPETFGPAAGGTIFDPSLPPVARYLRASLISFLSAWTAYFVIEMVYQIHAIEFTLLFRQRPSQWPPLFDAPWMATSIANFWGRRWHQLFRDCFVAVGSRPLKRYLGRVGGVMGAFFVSGILHDLGLRGMGRGGDSLVVIGFFLMNGVGLALEYAWKKGTGKYVGGFGGWLWMMTWMLMWGNLMVDAWARRGLVGSEFFPEAYRPTTLLLAWF